jgi:hypothetical protein
MSEPLSQLASHIDELFYNPRMAESDTIESLSQYVSDQMYDEVLSRYPQF